MLVLLTAEPRPISAVGAEAQPAIPLLSREETQPSGVVAGAVPLHRTRLLSSELRARAGTPLWVVGVEGPAVDEPQLTQALSELTAELAEATSVGLREPPRQIPAAQDSLDRVVAVALAVTKRETPGLEDSPVAEGVAEEEEFPAETAAMAETVFATL